MSLASGPLAGSPSQFALSLKLMPSPVPSHTKVATAPPTFIEIDATLGTLDAALPSVRVNRTSRVEGAVAALAFEYVMLFSKALAAAVVAALLNVTTRLAPPVPPAAVPIRVPS